MYEGGIHPRDKYLLSMLVLDSMIMIISNYLPIPPKHTKKGERVARAALAVAYGDTKVAYIGPVVGDFYVNYDKELLMVMIDNSSDIALLIINL